MQEPIGTQALRELVNALHADSPRSMPQHHQVFCNRNLQMRGIDAIGFDMDYTLALYHQEAMDKLSHEKTLERLVTVKGYPESVLAIEPRPRFAIRGLCVDKETGNIFKMDSHRFVGKVMRGFRVLSEEEREAYQAKPIRITERFHLVDTLFALPEAFLYAALIDHFEMAGGLERSPQELFEDIRACIDLAHSDDSLKNAIMANIEGYIVRDPQLAPTLHRLRSSGKRLFLMTNSYPRYTRAVMSYLLDGVLSEYPSWKNYFDVIITGARKPDFFSGGSPFLEVNDEDEVVGEEHERLARGRVYQGGNLAEFEALLGSSGPTVLYVGDHIYGDILRSKRASAWRTCMIVQEMTDELRRADTLRQEISERHELERELDRISDEIYFIHSLQRRFDETVRAEVQSHVGEGTSRVRSGSEEEGATGSAATETSEQEDEQRRVLRDLKFRVERLKRRRRRTIAEIHRLEGEIERDFNPYWGLVFKEGNELSIFGKQVQDYACLYTGRVSNLLAYSPLHNYRSPVELLPHEL